MTAFAPLKHTRNRLALAALSLSLLASVTPAQALEGKALLDAFIADLAKEGTTVTWSQINEASSDSFSMKDVKVVNKKGETVTLESVSVEGLQEVGNNRVSAKAIAVSGIANLPNQKGSMKIASISLSDANIPVGIWKGGLTAEERKNRLQVGNLSVSDMSFNNDKGAMDLNTLSLTKADIPLDWRFNPERNYEGEAARPLTFEVFGLAALKFESQGTTVKVGSISAQDGNVPTTPYAGMNDWMKVASSLAFNGFAVELGGNPVFSWDTMATTIAGPEADGTLRSTSTIDGIYANLKAIPDPKSQEMFNQLGYETVTGSASGSGSYNPNTGTVDVTDTILKLKDMFDMSFSYQVTGYTPEVANKLSLAQQQMQKGVPPQQAYGAILTDLIGVKLAGLDLSLTDRSLTGKLLDLQAQQMGTTGEQLAQAAPMMLGMGMGGLGMPQFTEMVTNAIGTFLKEKGTLSVVAAPPEPVSIVDLFLKGQANPAVVPDMLTLKVSAE